MIKSPLTDIEKPTNNHSGKRLYPITRFTPHCVVGELSAETVAGFAKFHDGKTASANYIIGKDGELLIQVGEDNRAWTSSNRDNDNRSITVECASDPNNNNAFNDKVYEKLVALCVDVCKRYNKKYVTWIPNKDKALAYIPADDELHITVHRFFAAVACPDVWFLNKLPEFVDRVNTELKKLTTDVVEKLYTVQIGAFANRENAEKLLKSIKLDYPDAFIYEKERGKS